MIMIEEYLGKEVRVLCTDGDVVIGRAFDVEDASEDEESTDDSLVMRLRDGRIMSVYLSDIERVEALD